MSALIGLDDLSSALEGLVPEVAVGIRGEWTTTHRRTYESEAQAGGGPGPFVEVADIRWRGTLECDVPLTGIAFLSMASEIYWAKSGRPTEEPKVEVSLHARADYIGGRATFTSALMDTVLPGVPVTFNGDVEASCVFGPSRFVTGRAHVVATVGEIGFAVILLPKAVIKMGRNRLWRLRDDVAAPLPDPVRLLLTRRRTGVLLQRTDTHERLLL